MPRKTIIVSIVLFLLVLNGAALGVLYLKGYIFKPTPEEIEAEKAEQERLRREVAEATRYDYLEPLPEFTSRVGYVASMGEAVDICERRLQEQETANKSWSINYIESRYSPNIEQYKIFLDYVTIPLAAEEPKMVKVICEVEEATKIISNWKAMPFTSGANDN